MARRPNFIVILTDDQGYGDLSCMGNTDFRTPHLDAVAARGARLTSWYSNSPVCSPSRASLLTGRYPGNAGVRSILHGHRTASGLPPEVPTLATALKKVGYRTALFGKWHLGLADGSRPNQHGFDTFFGFMAGCIDHYSHLAGPVQPRFGYQIHDLWEDGREVWRNGEYMTEMIAQRAVQHIRDSAGQPEPFFMYLAFNAPHYPMHAPAKFVDRFRHLPPDLRIMAAMISAIDDAVGDVVAELDRQQILDNTCIFFMSDNGPSRESRNWLDGRTDPYYGGSAGGLKGHKFSLFEGGIRVPGIFSWPAKIPAGQVLSAPAAAMDVFPTLMSAAGADPAPYEIDGQNLLPLLCDAKPLPERSIFWEMDKQNAVRQGRWKLTLNGSLVEGEPPQDPVFLADLEQDRGERQNQSAQHPDLVESLRAAALEWRAAIDRRWQDQWLPRINGATGHTAAPAASTR